MIAYRTGNLLDANVEALVNTVNTVGVMGKGVALMFKERYAKNMKEYAEACKAGEVQTGKMFVTNTNELLGVTWIINFPTKQHWRNNSKMEWIESGLQDLRMFIIKNNIKSIAIPPLGAGNGGLNWHEVKPKIVEALKDLEGVDVFIYEPTTKYQNVKKKVGISSLTPARALVLELIRRYLIIGMDCSQVEVQKLVYILSRSIASKNLDDPFSLTFSVNRYGPYAHNLTHLLNNLDGYYLLSNKRITDVQAFESTIKFNYDHKQAVQEYLQTASEGEAYLPALEEVVRVIDGFESPYGMELLATVDWLIYKEGMKPTLVSIKQGLKDWYAESGEPKWGQRKLNTFDDNSINLAIERLTGFSY